MTLRGSVEKRWGKSELTLRIEQQRDAGYIITRCLFCHGRIIHRGSAVEGRAAADLHRETKHPDVVPQKRRRVVKTHPGAAAPAARSGAGSLQLHHRGRERRRPGDADNAVARDEPGELEVRLRA